MVGLVVGVEKVIKDGVKVREVWNLGFDLFILGVFFRGSILGF